MKILRIIYDWPPPWDGLAPAPYEMTSAQLELGHEVEIFCGRWPLSGDFATLPGVKFHTFLREPLPGTLNLLISPFVLIRYLLWRRKNTPDVVHSHGHFAIWIYWYRVFLAKFHPKSKELKIPLVVQFHNTVKGRWEKLKASGKAINPVSQYISWPLGLKSDKWAVKAASACIFVGQENRQDAIKYYGADPEKCFLVESGVNVKLFTPAGPEEVKKIRQEMGFKSTDKVYFYNGAMVERKNIHLLVEALQLLPPDYKLLLVGPRGSDEYEARMHDVVIKFGLEHRLVRAGYTPYPEIPIAFQAADLFVLPSEFEGFPKVVVQSLACGIPTLVSGFKAKDEISGLKYITELTVENIAKEIQETLDNKNKVDVGFIRSHYSWNLMAKKVDLVYGKVFNR